MTGDFAHEPLPPESRLGTVGLWCKLHGERPGEIVVEEDVSGSVPVDERELGRLLRKIEDGASDGIVE